MTATGQTGATAPADARPPAASGRVRQGSASLSTATKPATGSATRITAAPFGCARHNKTFETTDAVTSAKS